MKSIALLLPQIDFIPTTATVLAFAPPVVPKQDLPKPTAVETAKVAVKKPRRQYRDTILDVQGQLDASRIKRIRAAKSLTERHNVLVDMAGYRDYNDLRPRVEQELFRLFPADLLIASGFADVVRRGLKAVRNSK